LPQWQQECPGSRHSQSKWYWKCNEWWQLAKGSGNAPINFKLFRMDVFRILIPTDFSEQAAYAYGLVRQLNSIVPLEVHLLHILPLPDTVSINAAGDIETCGDIDIQYVQRQKQVADANMAKLQADYGSRVYTHIQPGNITDSILQFAETNKVQLVVMGTRGAVGLQERLSGSETQVIARRSSVPVLSIMCDRFDLQLKKLSKKY
jgi:nucleotide-binding universal stress UspA family protein